MDLVVDSEVIFDKFYRIQELIKFNQIVEISIKQHHITIILKDSNIFYFADVLALAHDALVTPQSSYMTVSQDIIYLMIEDIPEDVDNIKSDFKELIQVIRYLSDNICKCPSLEFVFSGQYIKFYIDKPGLKLDDLKKVEHLFNHECTIEFTGQRPYILFINDKF